MLEEAPENLCRSRVWDYLLEIFAIPEYFSSRVKQSLVAGPEFQVGINFSGTIPEFHVIKFKTVKY